MQPWGDRQGSASDTDGVTGDGPERVRKSPPGVEFPAETEHTGQGTDYRAGGHYGRNRSRAHPHPHILSHHRNKASEKGVGGGEG